MGTVTRLKNNRTYPNSILTQVLERRLSIPAYDPFVSHPTFESNLQKQYLVGEQESVVEVPSFYAGNFKRDMTRALLEVGIFTYKDEEKKRIKIDGDIPISKFLNRLLGLEMAVQQALFQYFRSTNV